MSYKAIYMAEYLNDGHLSIPKEIADRLLLMKGEKRRVIVEGAKFNKNNILEYFGIWKDKSAEEIRIFSDIVTERKYFGRGEINI